MKLVAESASGAYLAYVSIDDSSQMPKEPLYVDSSQKRLARVAAWRALVITLRECS
ncbi:MAG: hypothetical protein IKM12_04225 [Alistipes sp.]|nr:hypothetical protein [Alistipes sp.]